jgi:predicted nucleic acid-binding protein
MSARVFLDTNVLVYAHDRGAGEKHEVAARLVSELWENRSGSLSTQVLQEFYVNVRRKAARPISAQRARTAIQDYLTWNIIVNSGDSILDAVDLEHCRLHWNPRRRCSCPKTFSTVDVTVA